MLYEIKFSDGHELMIEASSIPQAAMNARTRRLNTALQNWEDYKPPKKETLEVKADDGTYFVTVDIG